MKRQTILNIAASLICLAFLVGGGALYLSANQDRGLDTVRVNVVQTASDAYLTADGIGAQVEELISSGSGLDLYAIEQNLRATPYAQNVEIYRTMDGACVVDIAQHEPALRFLTSTGYDFYVDEALNILPPPVNHYFSTPTITGDWSFSLPAENFFSPLAKNSPQDIAIIKILLNFVNVLQSDSFLRDFITQIYLNHKREIILTPRVSGVRILVGDLTEGAYLGSSEATLTEVPSEGASEEGRSESVHGEDVASESVHGVGVTSEDLGSEVVDSVEVSSAGIASEGMNSVVVSRIKMEAGELEAILEGVDIDGINQRGRDALAKLKFMCQKGFPQSWWTAIGDLDLRYKNQVVVTQKNPPKK